MIDVYIMDAGPLGEASLFQAAWECMPKERAQKIGSVKNNAAKNLSLAAGILLDFGLERRGMSYRDIVIEKGEHGKPYIAGRRVPFFNLSHSGTKAVCAIADTEIGVDIEQIKDKEIKKPLMRKVCTDEERTFLEAIASVSEQAEQFYKLWTVKESIMKQSGIGLAMEPGGIDAAAAFEKDLILCQGTAVRIHREQDYYISVCTAKEEPVRFRQIDIKDYKKVR